MTADAELLRRLDRNADAFEEFYCRHVERVTRFAARRCASAGDVADVVSATFLAVIDAAHSYDPRRGQPHAWLLGIAAHQIAALYERAARERDTARRIAGRRLLDSDDIARLEAKVDAERLAPTVSWALAQAPPGERELLLLIVQDELTPSEAARALGISPIAARVRLSRVRRRIQIAADQPPSSAIPTRAIAKERP